MEAPGRRTVYRTCPLCEATCGLAIDVEGERVVRIRGDRDDVLSHGFICPKGPSLAELHEDPDRLREPLIRRNGHHEPATWDECFQEIERRLLPILEEHGRNALAVYVGNPNVHNLAGSLYLRPVLRAAGTRNLYSASTVDQMPKHVSSGLLFGDANAIPVPDLDRCEYLLMLGANPLESNGSLCTAPDFPGRLRAIRERGGRVVVVDPRRTRSARAADEHVFIRPGSDALLLLALLQVLHAEGRVAPGALGAHLSGADALGPRLTPFTPDRVAPACGVPADRIRGLARELAGARRAAVYGRIGTHTTGFGTLASWAVDALNILTGNLDRAGGAMFPLAAHGRARKSAGGRGMRLGRWRSRVRDLPEVRGELPVATLADEIETPGEGQVRALLSVAGNPVLSTPDATRLDAALAKLDLVICVDPYLNETTRHADVLLPPPSPLERSHYDLAFSTLAVRNVANYSPAVFTNEGPPEHEILARLALLLSGRGADADPAELDELLVRGLLGSAVSAEGSPVEGRDPDELRAELGERSGPEHLLDIMLRCGPYGDGFGAAPDGLSLERLEAAPHGVDLGALEPRLPEILSTPSAKIELAPDAILQDIDRAAERLDASARAAPGDLVLVGRRHVRSNNSWMHNLPSLASGRSRCSLEIHPEDATKLGVADGDRVRVRSRVGQVEVDAAVTEDILQGVVCLPHGWGHDRPGARLAVAAERPGVNSNQLTDGAELDPLSGNAVLNGIPVEVERA